MDDQATTRRIPAVKCSPTAPAGHRVYHEIDRTDDEIFDEAHTCEPLDRARARLGPRLRCECGRGFGSAAALDAHQQSPDDRDQRRR